MAQETITNEYTATLRLETPWTRITAMTPQPAQKTGVQVGYVHMLVLGHAFRMCNSLGTQDAIHMMCMQAGVILHPTSLPGPYGIGEIGKEAYKFIDWIASTGMQVWQVLPLVPPETQFWSPYAGLLPTFSKQSLEWAACPSQVHTESDSCLQAFLLLLNHQSQQHDPQQCH